MNTIDAKTLQRAFLAGARELDSKKEWINELNVFPVPDGDTGTNMTMTILSAAREAEALEDPTMETLAKAISSGSLRGARGNSGVILSQLLRGFTKEIRSVDVITTTTLANAFVRGKETAYKAVMKPKEGTILTVARGMADRAVELAPETEDIIEFVQALIECGDQVLSQTPEMLPILKQAGVVDSGGQGLMQVMKGILKGLLDEGGGAAGEKSGTFMESGASLDGASAAETSGLETSDIRYGYCTEFIVELEKEYDDDREREFAAYLESIGDSIVLVSEDGLVKVHVHTNDPGLAIQKALTYGSLSRIKIDNMREEHHERLIRDAEKLAARRKEEAAAGAGQAGGGSEADRNEQADGPKAGESGQAGRDSAVTRAEQAGDGADAGQSSQTRARKAYGFIAVSAGAGFADIFAGIGADHLIEGGQTMNPSTEDMLNAIDQVDADTIYILPNNGNIILAAEQAAHLTEDKKIVVVPSETVPQGISAIINFAPELSPEENMENMIREMRRIKTAEITYAVRRTQIGGMEIEEGDIMALDGDGILAVGKSVETTALDALRGMVDEDSELVSIYYGQDIAEAEAGELTEKVRRLCPECEVELNFGGQPIYYYLISVE